MKKLIATAAMTVFFVSTAYAGDSKPAEKHHKPMHHKEMPKECRHMKDGQMPDGMSKDTMAKCHDMMKEGSTHHSASKQAHPADAKHNK